MKHKYLTIATTSFYPSETIRESTDRLLVLIKKLKLENPDIDLIVTCELSLNKYLDIFTIDGYLESVAISLDSRIINEFKVSAKENNVNLSIGFTEEKQGKYYNSQVLINRMGEVYSVHRKTNLTAFEAKVFDKGNTTITMCDFEGITLGTSICYDMMDRSPLKKIQPHLLVVSLTDPGEPKFTIGTTGRFNSGYYVSANRFGIEKHKDSVTDYNGHIGIVSPLGKILDLKHGEESHIIRELKIRIKQPKLLMILRSISCKLLMIVNVIAHMGKVIDYLKWHFRMKREKKKKQVKDKRQEMKK